MEKDTEAKIERTEVKLRKKIEATLWKAGYVTSKPVGLVGMSEGHEVMVWKGLVFICYHTDKGQQRKMQMLTKYRDALKTQGWQADIDNPEDPSNQYRRDLHAQAIHEKGNNNPEDLCIYACSTINPDVDYFW